MMTSSQTQMRGRVLPVARQHVQRPGGRIVLGQGGQYGLWGKPGPAATVKAREAGGGQVVWRLGAGLVSWGQQ